MTTGMEFLQKFELVFGLPIIYEPAGHIVHSILPKFLCCNETKGEKRNTHYAWLHKFYQCCFFPCI